ncbi:PspC domain-containing protein [Gryllotalpicola koreensis]|uniref:Phage shock protein PspC N-terminal domain-containing protein n=1 Tax=Gryllotalpicola koreensis TaxID=993086 RepID=A0ABP8AC28_9MICO
MTNQTSTPTSPPNAPRPASNRFFTWLRSLGVVRADGWIGGVCGGIALRTGLDPLIVRGIAVVIAILGGPALFFYAAAWLLLPDAQGEIHLERMLRGIFDAPLIGIGILVVLTFVPFTNGVWWWGDHITASAWWIAAPAVVLRVLWNLAVLGAIVWFIVWLVRRYRSTPPGQRPFAASQAPQPDPAAGAPFTATPQAPAQTASAAPQGEATASAPETPAQASDQKSGEQPPDAPSAPGAGATKDDLSEWRERYDAWRQQHQAWQEQQRAQTRAVRDARSAEVRAQSQALAAQLEQNRLARRAANPRLAGWGVALVIGVALVAGGIAGVIATGDADISRYAAPIGMAVALMAIGLGMVVAGAARRRSGFLAFLAIATMVIGLGSFGWPVHNAPVGYTQLRADRDITYTQFAGQVEIDAAAADLGSSGTREVEIDQTFGAVAVYLGDGVKARVDVTSTDSEVHPYQREDGEMEPQPVLHLDAADGAKAVQRSWDNTDGGTADLVIDVTQGHGGVYIYQGGERPDSGFGYLD